MSTERFDDEILSAIIDGEADQEIVASVAADPAARARLVQLRAAVSAVQTPVPDATPERRAASIAAAMAAATPAPEVSSLAAARHTRTEQAVSSRRLNPQWIALAAAAILLVVAIPLLVRSTNSEADFATSADDSASLSADDTGSDESADTGDSADSAEEVVEQAQAAADGEAMEEAADVVEADSGADAIAPVADADDSAAEEAEEPAEAEEETTAFRLSEAQVANSAAVLDDLIAIGSIIPELTADEVIAEGVSPECVDPLDLDGGATFALAFLDPFGGGPRLVLISFNIDGTTTTLDAEDCSPLG